MGDVLGGGGGLRLSEHHAALPLSLIVPFLHVPGVSFALSSPAAPPLQTPRGTPLTQLRAYASAKLSFISEYTQLRVFPATHQDGGALVLTSKTREKRAHGHSLLLNLFVRIFKVLSIANKKE